MKNFNTLTAAATSKAYDSVILASKKPGDIVKRGKMTMVVNAIVIGNTMLRENGIFHKNEYDDRFDPLV